MEESLSWNDWIDLSNGDNIDLVVVEIHGI